MEGSSDCKKRKGGEEQDGESGGKLVPNCAKYRCSICSERLLSPIFTNYFCASCRDKLHESGRAATRRSRTMEQLAQNFFLAKGPGIFYCSTCSKPLAPPIFQCSKGNPICSPCRDKLPESEQAAAQRCYVMERVVDNIFVPCKYGCNRMPFYCRKDRHEKQCLLGRPFVCPVSGCGFVALNEALLDHLTTLHKLPETPIDFFTPSNLPVNTGSQLLCSEFGCLFLLDVVSLDSFGHAVYIVCVRPETPVEEIEVIVQFSPSGRDLQVSKNLITPDAESRQYLCVLPPGEPDAKFSIEIRMLYIANDEVQEELLEEEDDDDDEDYQDYDDEEEDD